MKSKATCSHIGPNILIFCSLAVIFIFTESIAAQCQVFAAESYTSPEAVSNTQDLASMSLESTCLSELPDNNAPKKPCLKQGF
ncbi:MAG: hypothetical protein WBC05_24710 [Sedimentisphaerales bacterium]